MILHWSVAAIGLFLAAIGACVATYLIIRSKLKSEIDAIRAEMTSLLVKAPSGFTQESPKSEAVLSEPRSAEVLKAPVPAPACPTPAASPASEGLAHETLVVIAAAVSAFLGKSVRLRSARLIHPSEGNAWAQQGRVFVQASHNLGLTHN